MLHLGGVLADEMGLGKTFTGSSLEMLIFYAMKI